MRKVIDELPVIIYHTDKSLQLFYIFRAWINFNSLYFLFTRETFSRNNHKTEKIDNLCSKLHFHWINSQSFRTKFLKHNFNMFQMLVPCLREYNNIINVRKYTFPIELSQSLI